MVNQLVIIGNGFDLHCKLDTRFTDYFDSNKPAENDNIAQNFINCGHNYDYKIMLNSPYLKEYSFWDIYFNLLKSNDIKDWADVEKKLHIFFLNEEKESSLFRLINLKFLYKYFSEQMNPLFYQSVKEKLNVEIAKYKDDHIEDISQKLCEYTYTKMLINYELINLGKNLNDLNDLNDLITEGREFLYKFLYNQLHIFEKNLKEYIKRQIGIEDNNSYNFEKIIIYRDRYNKTIEKISDNKPYNLISFNYTRPLTYGEENAISSEFLKKHREIKEYKPSNCKSITNIHGELNKNIIIGIDENKVNAKEDLYKFTKTYRLLELGNSPNGLDKNIKHIKFYGHSLSEADYSYFQSIFDFYDIYNSDVSLVFYYSNFGTDQKHIMIDRVVKLIKTYGNTLNNKDHGKNLLHKLKLENRVLIKELKD